MNAQEKWKAYFREMKKQHRQSSRRRFRRYMKGERNRAALERIIARLKRRIEYLEADLKLAQQQAAESEERREFAARAWAERN